MTDQAQRPVLRALLLACYFRDSDNLRNCRLHWPVACGPDPIDDDLYGFDYTFSTRF